MLLSFNYFYMYNFRFLAVFSESVAREGELPGNEVEYGGHVFHRPVPASFALHG